MAKRKSTKSKSHLTLVISKTLLGLRRHVRLVSNYGSGIEEIVMTTQRYSTRHTAYERAYELGEQLGIEVVVEE
jgi:hypothetical protein